MSDAPHPLADRLRELSTRCHGYAVRSKAQVQQLLHAEWAQMSSDASEALQMLLVEIEHLDQLITSVYGADVPKPAPAGIINPDRVDQQTLLRRARDAEEALREALKPVGPPSATDFTKLENALERCLSIARRLPAAVKTLGERAEDWRDQRRVANRRFVLAVLSLIAGLTLLWGLGAGQRAANRFDIASHVSLADSALVGASHALHQVDSALAMARTLPRADTLRSVRMLVTRGLETARSQVRTGIDALDRAQVLSHSSTEPFATSLAVLVSRAVGMANGADAAGREFAAASSGRNGTVNANWLAAAAEYSSALRAIVDLPVATADARSPAPRSFADAFLGRSPGAFLVKAAYALAYILIAGGVLMVLARLFTGPLQLQDTLQDLFRTIASSGVTRALWPLLVPAGLLAGAFAATPQLDSHLEEPLTNHVDVIGADTSAKLSLDAVVDSIHQMRVIVDSISKYAR